VEGCRTGVFNVPNRDAALDLGVGIVFSSALTILRGRTKADHPEASAYLLLLGLGVPADRARDVIRKPLAIVPAAKSV
jgi:hypothetical protein